MIKIAEKERIERYVLEEHKPENKNAERMGRPKQKAEEVNRANLKRFCLEELKEMSKNTIISHEFYCLVKAELERRKTDII